MIHKDEIAIRQKVNRLLVKELETLVEKHPTQRFGQILMNYFFFKYNSLDGLHFRNMVYNEEPTKTLSNLGE